MVDSPRDAADAEKALHELERYLERPKKSVSFKDSPHLPGAGHDALKLAVNRTAYLDGLRGFAALLVYSLHHQVWGHSGMGGEFILENAFGWNGKYRKLKDTKPS
jgi:hypothetical protein